MKPRVVGLAAVLPVASAVAALLGSCRSGDGLVLHGTVEARSVHVGSKVGGRVAEVLAKPGDRIAAGQVVLTFEDRELRAALERARADLEKLEAGFRPEEIEEARAAAAASKAAYEEARTGYRKEQIAAAEAEVERARSEAVRAEGEFRRVSEVADSTVYSRQERENLEAAWKAARAALAAAEQRHAELASGYRPEQVAAADAEARRTEAVLALRVRGSRAEDIAMAKAALLDAEARWDERRVLAPADATVEVLDLRPGDIVPAGTPVATLLETSQVYVRVFVPETRLGLVRLGAPAEIRVDSFPDRPFRGVIQRINHQGEFLPRNVQTAAERVHQVFGVEVRAEDPEGALRPGMAAEVRIRTEGGA